MEGVKRKRTYLQPIKNRENLTEEGGLLVCRLPRKFSISEITCKRSFAPMIKTLHFGFSYFWFSDIKEKFETFDFMMKNINGSSVYNFQIGQNNTSDQTNKALKKSFKLIAWVQETLNNIYIKLPNKNTDTQERLKNTLENIKVKSEGILLYIYKDVFLSFQRLKERKTSQKWRRRCFLTHLALSAIYLFSTIETHNFAEKYSLIENFFFEDFVKISKNLNTKCKVYLIDVLYKILVFGCSLGDDKKILNSLYKVEREPIYRFKFMYVQVYREFLDIFLAGRSLISPEIENEKYNITVKKFLNNVYFFSMEKNFKKFTTMNGKVFVRVKKAENITNHILNKGYILIELLYQFSEFSINIDLKSSEEWLFNSIFPSQTIKQIPNHLAIQSNQNLKGDLISSLLGSQLQVITTKGAEFLLNKKNWKLDQLSFSAAFESLNSLSNNTQI